MITKEIGTYSVTIAGQKYEKWVQPIRDFLSDSYHVYRINAKGEEVRAYLNPNTHRQMIRRIEAALERM